MPDDKSSLEIDPVGTSTSRLEILDVAYPKEIRSRKLSHLFTWIGLLILIVAGFGYYFFSHTIQKGAPIPTRYLVEATSPGKSWVSYQVPDKAFSIQVPADLTKVNLNPQNSLDFLKTANGVSSLLEISSFIKHSSAQSTVDKNLFSSESLFRTYLHSSKISYSESAIILHGQPATEFYTGKTDGKTPCYAVFQDHNKKYYAFKLFLKPDPGVTSSQLSAEMADDRQLFSRVLGSVNNSD